MIQDEAEGKTVARFFSEYGSKIIFVATLCFVIVFSLSTLVTKPRLWSDEAVSISVARSFFTHGILSPQIAPDKFFEPPAFIQSTGYPVTVTLAGFFNIFGYGLEQGRIFMLIWMLAALALVFFLAKKLFSKWQACASLLLISGFASFYGSGRTVVGEIPGFVFLLAGFYFLLEKKHYFLTGVFWGLAVVTKPSVFGLIIPAIVLTFLFERGGFLKKTLTLGAGMIPAALMWIALVVSHPFNTEVWRGLVTFYNNPFSSSISENVARNLAGFFHSTTLIYFGFFFLLVIGVRLTYEITNPPRRTNGYEKNIPIFHDISLKTLYTFTLVYSVLAFLYYLRSPGWLRYILIAELLMLFVLPSVVVATSAFVEERFKKITLSSSLISGSVLGFLITLQFVQMFTSAQIFYGDDDLRAAAYLQKNFPDKSIGLLNSLELSTLLPPSRVYLTFYNIGLPVVGENPLFRESPPDVIVTDPKNRFADEGKEVLNSRYVSSGTAGGYSIYIRK